MRDITDKDISCIYNALAKVAPIVRFKKQLNDTVWKAVTEEKDIFPTLTFSFDEEKISVRIDYPEFMNAIDTMFEELIDVLCDEIIECVPNGR